MEQLDVFSCFSDMFGDTGGKLKPLKAPKKGDKDYDEVSWDNPASQIFKQSWPILILHTVFLLFDFCSG